MQKYEHFLTDYFSDLENEKNVPFFVFDAQNRPFFALKSPSESKNSFPNEGGQLVAKIGRFMSQKPLV